ncbi:MAG TPA: phosphoketolase family protein [Candidatus Nanopelagicaceae bacterium]|nr:phosphoketolase family protein [Candidatus Nanopelagicaceae bacterium]
MVQTEPLSADELAAMNAWWRAANYLALGQTYLMENPLLESPLTPEQIKPTLLGHWGSAPGLNFIYVHLNRIIVKHDLDMIYIAGPGHCGHAMIANAYLDGTYSQVYPDVSLDRKGLARLFKQFSFPGGVPSHVAPETPGSIHEGGELGYSLLHAFGAAFDNPDLIVAAIVSDGESETGPLAASWHSNKFLNPARDGAVLPIFHLNGYKISMPTVLARITPQELDTLLRGYGWDPYLVEGEDPDRVHPAMAEALDRAVAAIHQIQAEARSATRIRRPAWPMIVLRTPAGWTAPKEVDGLPAEGTWRCHLTPLEDPKTNPGHLAQLQTWFQSYRAHELFDENGTPRRQITRLAPAPGRRMSDNPNANGGLLKRNLRLPELIDYAVAVPAPGAVNAEATRVLSAYLRDVMTANSDRFRVFGPDETASNRLSHLFEVSDQTFLGEILPTDEFLSPEGRIMDVLSEHLCQGWLEGYLLTGRHGLFNTYEAFAHVVDSMFNQHAKWISKCNGIPWRRPIASLNYLLTSHVWRQDHNGFTHQDPGFLDVMLNKKAAVVRIYLPPDANCLLSVADHCLASENYVNAIVADKQAAPNWLDMESAIRHCTAGIGIWEWASTDAGAEPDVVMACAGDVPTLETMAAVDILRQRFPDLKMRVVNVVDLMVLQPKSDHPHGLSDQDFDQLFTRDKPVIFAFHGYPWLIHRLTYRRTNHDNIHVHGYQEEGSVTTPFDMAVCNDLDRFHLVADVADRVPALAAQAAYVKQWLRDKLVEHQRYITEHGEDLPEVRAWVWRG